MVSGNLSRCKASSLGQGSSSVGNPELDRQIRLRRSMRMGSRGCWNVRPPSGLGRTKKFGTEGIARAPADAFAAGLSSGPRATAGGSLSLILQSHTRPGEAHLVVTALGRSFSV